MCPVDTAEILRVLSDDKSLTLFNMIAFTLRGKTGIIMTRLGLTRKQYYSRMSGLIDTGLIMRKNGVYFLTSLGKVVYEFQLLIGQAVENYWKLKALDSVEMSIPEGELFANERKKIIDTLVENENIKNVLL